MFIEASEVAAESSITADICILGAGAAGITLAREMSGMGLQIAVLESGGLMIETQTQALYAGDNTGMETWPLHLGRLRYFGGTTGHWGGVCRPLNPIDFEHRDWVSGSGWPVTYDDLHPYYERAKPLVQISSKSFAVDDWETPEYPRLPMSAEDGQEAKVVSEIVQRSPPTRFGDTYREELARADDISVYLHANAINIDSNADADHVTRVEVSTLSGHRWYAQARLFVLAQGGLENPRLLLLSDNVDARGLGNHHDLVGRYFADHSYLSNIGFLVLNSPNFKPDLYFKRHETAGEFGDAYLALSDAERREQQLMGIRIHFSESTQKKFAQRPKFESLSQMLARNFRELVGYDEFADENIQVLRFGAWIESEPNPASRVTLSDDLDSLGQRKIALNWQNSEKSKASMLQSLDIVAAEVARAGLGRMRIDVHEDIQWPWQGGGEPGLHHMGTTRMHTDPGQGVVDHHCKVHGVDNLFVAGSSTFPTYGTSNPTLTILALTLRLSDHLKLQLG